MVEHANGYVIWGCVHGHVQGRRAECNEDTRDEGMQLPGMDDGWMRHKGAILKRYDSRVAVRVNPLTSCANSGIERGGPLLPSWLFEAP